MTTLSSEDLVSLYRSVGLCARAKATPRAYGLLAAIAECHAMATSAGTTDWGAS